MNNTLQDQYLNQIRKANEIVTIYLVDASQIHGKIMGFDNFAIILLSAGKRELIYKHAISRIIPVTTMQKNTHINTQNAVTTK